MTSEDLEFEFRWGQLLNKIHQRLGIRPKDLNGVLFLIGVQELGKGFRSFSKEEKQDLMHIAICRLLSKLGFYELEGLDKDGWPHWKLLKPLPQFDLLEQEKLLKIQAIEYFEEEKIFS
ncbi:MAG: hypothetical protein RMJ97_01330 [Raineya sp.]|nr:hypothetical protein [Raineya sp.]MDW8295500.1 hypothetical protein [Raineya sp.]